MNAAAATMMAFTRRPLLRMQMLRDVTDDYVPYSLNGILSVFQVCSE